MARPLGTRMSRETMYSLEVPSIYARPIPGSGPISVQNSTLKQIETENV